MTDMLTLTNVVTGLTVLISLACFNNHNLYGRLIFNPFEVEDDKQYYRLLTSGFIHTDFGHLLFNMVALWSFGNFVESAFESFFGTLGITLYLVFYLSAIAVAHLPSFLKRRHSTSYYSLGASGGVSAIVFAAILLDPMGTVNMFGILPMKGIVWGVVYLLYEQFASRHIKDNVGHDAHLWGAGYGVVFMIAAHPVVVSEFIAQVLHGL